MPRPFMPASVRNAKHWSHAVRGEHGIPVVYANLVGGQDELVFDGASFVADRTGRILHRAAAFEEDLLHVRTR